MTTKSQLAKIDRNYGMFVIQHLFLMDLEALRTDIK
ncbi:beta/alpha barrel domain-containing protein [Thermosinus carboxydivorans]